MAKRSVLALGIILLTILAIERLVAAQAIPAPNSSVTGDCIFAISQHNSALVSATTYAALADLAIEQRNVQLAQKYLDAARDRATTSRTQLANARVLCDLNLSDMPEEK